MANKDRIGSDCWYHRYCRKSGALEWRRGVVLAWLYDPSESALAVVEDAETNRCADVAVVHVSFANEAPDE